jgi:hypothetical protein
MEAVAVPPTTPKAKKIHQKTAWDLHVEAFRQAHPDMKFKEVLQSAKETYQKKGKVSAADVAGQGSDDQHGAIVPPS